MLANLHNFSLQLVQNIQSFSKFSATLSAQTLCLRAIATYVLFLRSHLHPNESIRAYYWNSGARRWQLNSWELMIMMMMMMMHRVGAYL